MRLFFGLAILILAQYSASKPTDDGRIVFRDENEADLADGILQPDSSGEVAISDIDVHQTGSEMGAHFQGDIVLTEEEKKEMLSTDGTVGTRTGLLDLNKRWPKDSAGHVNVPYKIDEKSGYS